MSPTRKTAQRKRIQPRVKVWLELEGDYVFGRGISTILKAVAETGSIKAAAESLGKSYRYVWSRIKQAEHALEKPLVETQVGGSGPRRSSLTELADNLVRRYDELRQRMSDVLQDEFSTQFDDWV